MGLFDLLQFSLSSLFYGVLITVVCLVLFFVLIRGWYKSATMTPISYIVGIVLFFLLSFQCTLIMGAIKVIHISDFFAGEVQQLMQPFFQNNQEVTARQSTQIVENLVDTYPVLGHFFQSGEFTGYTAAELPEVMRQTICTFLRWFIVRRLLWCLAFVVVGAFLVIKSLGSTHATKRQTTSYSTHYPHANRSRSGF
ncbi:MAG: hypothetical protein ACI37U_11450 [Bacteroides sp.]